MAEDSDDKTEDPTTKRLNEARKEGNVPQSMEARALMSLVLAIILIAFIAPRMALDLTHAMEPLIERPHAFSLRPEDLTTLLAQLGITVGKAMAVLFVLVIATGMGASLVQTKGFLWVPKRIMPNFEKLSPLSGAKRLFSVQQVIDLIKQLVKLGVLGAMLGWVFWISAADFQNLATLELVPILDYISDKIYWMVAITLGMMIVLTAGDYFFQRYRWMEKMKMTRQEVRDEHKQSEGDPQVKAKLRSLRMQRARRRMMAAVPKADVVVTNPTHFAVALKYDMEAMTAPILVAKGADLVAKRIRDLADENDVPIVENPPVARALYATVELDQEIPPEHYKAVAEIIGYVMRLKGKLAT